MADTLIKICGLSTPETVDAAVEAGADYVGFVHYEPSPRHVEARTARELRARLPKSVKAVLLTVNMEPIDVARILDAVQPNVIQFHGRETADWLRMLQEQVGDMLEIWKALGLKSRDQLEGFARFEGAADRLLYDAPPKALPGGNGAAFDWSLLAGHDHPMPWGLAGGLAPDNVAEAIAATGAPLVDTSSGVESAPGVKDVDRIRAFCEAVKS